jgi:glyoxylase-like metal-dependent hydrolase (beta-lactamase superfamily II)
VIIEQRVIEKGCEMKNTIAAVLAMALVPCIVHAQALEDQRSAVSLTDPTAGLSLLAQASEAAKPEAKAPAPKPAAPPYETKKVDATDNVYIFRHGNVQAMFVVTSAGVIATDPISYANRQASTVYLEEIRKVTKQPLKYVIYSHHHFDHIAGGKPFKDAGAKFVAHKNAKTRLEMLKDPHTVVPDEIVNDKRTIKLGDTTLELHYLGRNHSDSTLIMRLPQDKIIFAVDLMPVGSFPGRAIIDSYPLEWEATLRKVLAMDWERMIPGHPGAPGGRLGTKQDVRDVLALLQEASAEIQTAAREGKCWDQVEKEFKMPKYEKWPGYQTGLPMVARRYCGLWGRGT